MSDSEMVDYLAHCFYEPGHPRPSIETFLHGFLPFTHIDHTHADATNYFACAADGEALARDCFGDDLIWIPYRRPGFGLARQVALALRAKPNARLVILAKHGLITWGDTDEACYASTMATITQARDFVEARIARADRAVFGGPRVTTLAAEERRHVTTQVAPLLCGLVSADKRQILRFEDSQDVLDFVGSQDAPRLTTIGAACPDHLVHTKPWPLLVNWTPNQDVAALMEALRAGLCDQVSPLPGRKLPTGSRSRRRHPGLSRGRRRRRSAPARDPDPGCGHVYHRQRRHDGRCLGPTHAPLHRRHAWCRGLWRLYLSERCRELRRRILAAGAVQAQARPARARVRPARGAGHRGGIGSAICRRMAQDGAHIVATDIDLAGAEQLATSLNEHFGAGRAVAVKMDVTNEESVRAALEQAALAFGGIDAAVNNAGLASSAPLTETSLAE